MRDYIDIAGVMSWRGSKLTRRDLECMFHMPYAALVQIYYRKAWERQALWFWMEWPIPRASGHNEVGHGPELKPRRA